jgi:hypothetical protein
VSEALLIAPALQRRRRWPAVAAFGFLVMAIAAAVVLPDEGEPELRLATQAPAGAVAVPDTSPLPTLPVTVPATVPLPVTVPPVPVTVPKLPPVTVPRPSTTTTMTTEPVPVATPGTRCGTPSGYGGYGATQTVTSGRIKATVEIYHCESYDGEQVQNFVHVDDSDGVLVSVHLDFGDGTVHEGGVYRWACDDPKRPRPYVFNGPWHSYAAAGAYPVTATVTTAGCSGGQEQTATVSVTAHRIAGPRPRA